MAKILLLEDDPGLRFLVGAGLRDAGHDLTIAANIAEAVKSLRFEQPDVIVLDLMIGQESSLGVADLAAYTAPNAEVIFMTGSGMFPSGELFSLAKNIGWVLRKPVDLNELSEIVDYSLARSSREQPHTLA